MFENSNPEKQTTEIEVLDQNRPKLKDEETLLEQENKKTYEIILKNQLLGVENGELLNDMFNSDENIFNQDTYSQMQKKADSAGPRMTKGSLNDIYCGAFAYTSPPDRPSQFDGMEHQNVSPFQSRYNVL